MRSLGIRSGAAGPILSAGASGGRWRRVWSDAAEMPVGAEDRVAAFAELVAYAIENAEARDEIAASRARLVEAADEARRRIERDLHDGAQQHLVAAALELTMLDNHFDRDPAAARAALARAREQLDGGLGELRDLARGIHPSVLTDRGLAVALEGLVKRSPIPVELSVDVPNRLDTGIEAAAYFLVSEALTNAAKHARADRVTVEVAANGDTVVVSVADDGVGGAETGRGSGLGGLTDRVEAVERPAADHEPARRRHDSVRAPAHERARRPERSLAACRLTKLIERAPGPARLRRRSPIRSRTGSTGGSPARRAIRAIST